MSKSFVSWDIDNIGVKYNTVLFYLPKKLCTVYAYRSFIINIVQT